MELFVLDGMKNRSIMDDRSTGCRQKNLKTPYDIVFRLQNLLLMYYF